MATITPPFKEPLTETGKRYIYINPNNNRVHVMIPIVGGTDIATDNTCRTVVSLKTCMGHGEDSVTSVLTKYKEALEYDLQLMKILPDNPVKKQKQERLDQIKKYLSALYTVTKHPSMGKLREGFAEYPEPIQRIINHRTTSNLYGMILCPSVKDNIIRVKEPIFSVQRGESRSDTQFFYHALFDGYKDVVIGKSKDHRDILKNAALEQYLKEEKQRDEDEKKSADETVNDDDFKKIQNKLTSLAPPEEKINFDRPLPHKGMPEDKDLNARNIYDFLGVTTPKEYIDALVQLCVPEIKLVEDKAQESLRSPFNLSDNMTTDHRQEKLIILTQFFMAQVNIYCFANDISFKDFGKVLDEAKDPALSIDIATTVKAALKDGASVENALFDFINKNHTVFSLTRELNETDRAEIQKKFTKQYITIEDSLHFDDFMVFYPRAMSASFFTHQGFICVDFSSIIAQSEFKEENTPYFEETRTLSEKLPRIIEPVPEVANKDDVEIDDNALKAYVGSLNERDLKIQIAHAVRNNDINFLRLCKAAGINLNYKDEKGNTLIHIASSSNLADLANMINFLRDVCGINPLEKNNGLQTAIHLLAEYGYHNMLTKQALLGPEEKNVPLDDKDLNAKDKRGFMPVHLAAMTGKDSIIALLPEEGINDQTNFGESAAHYAVKRIKTLKQLRDRGANLNVKSKRGKTPFDTAIEGLHFNSAYFLMTEPLQKYPLPEDKKTADARKKAHWKMFQKLTAKYLSQDFQINRGLTDAFKTSEYLKAERLKEI